MTKAIQPPSLIGQIGSLKSELLQNLQKLRIASLATHQLDIEALDFEQQTYQTIKPFEHWKDVISALQNSISKFNTALTNFESSLNLPEKTFNKTGQCYNSFYKAVASYKTLQTKFTRANDYCLSKSKELQERGETLKEEYKNAIILTQKFDTLNKKFSKFNDQPKSIISSQTKNYPHTSPISNNYFDNDNPGCCCSCTFFKKNTEPKKCKSFDERQPFNTYNSQYGSI